jgi:hypothetical protein
MLFIFRVRKHRNTHKRNSFLLPPIKKQGRQPFISTNVKSNLIKSIENCTHRTSDTLTLWQKNILKPADPSIETLLEIERDREAISLGVNTYYSRENFLQNSQICSTT